MMKRIKIFDTTLRDGEQSPGASMSVEQKLKMAVALERLGVDRIEAGFPVSSPLQFQAVQEIAAALKKSTVVALARCVESDIDAACKALQPAKNKMLHIFLATSPIHRDTKLKMSKEQVLAKIAALLEYASQYCSLIEFSAEDASRTEPDFLLEVIRTAIAHGAKTINIPDTVGYALPSEFGELIKMIVAVIPEIKDIDLSVHCHNDLGLAVANSLAAVQNGATQVEVTLNGIGERAGNCSLEELVMTLNVRQDMLKLNTGIKAELLYSASRLLMAMTGLIIPRNKPVFGDNAFAHESGIHQDGVIKNRDTYEIMRPQSIGRSLETLVMGRHSGKHAFKKKLEQYGVHLNAEQFERAFQQFTILADKKKEVYDEDIFEIAATILGRVTPGFQLIYFHAFTGNSILPTATVKIRKEGEDLLASSTGDGPVDALFQAIEAAVKIQCKLREYTIQAIGSGQDAQGHVNLRLEIAGQEYTGRHSSPDIIEASATAFINAVNRYCLSISTNEWLPRVVYSQWPIDELI
jgi:2-isopropylmalate synthase